MIGGLVSIITPLYKSEKYIEQTLFSVQNQTYKNWEMLCIDDCSPDNTAQIIQKFQKNDPRIKYLKRDKNYGSPAHGRNFGLAQANGQYITFLDHDDTFEPTKLEEMVKEMDAQAVDFLVSNIYLYSDIKDRREGLAWRDVRNYDKQKFAPRLLWRNFVPPNSTLIKKSTFDKVGLFDTSIKGVDDYDMWYRIARICSSGVLNQPLASWRYKNKLSLSADDLMMVENEIKFYQKIRKADWTESWEKKMARFCLLRCYKMFANRMLLRGKYTEAVKNYEMAELFQFARAVRFMGPFLRVLYYIKYKITDKISPFVLDFSDYEKN